MIEIHSDIRSIIVSYLALEDLLACCQVSKVWKEIFEKDEVWVGESHKWGVSKGSYLDMLLEALALSSLKAKVKNEYLLKALTIPKKFIKVIGSLEGFYKLPFREIPHSWNNNISVFAIAPIVRSVNCILFRTVNNKSEERLEVLDYNTSFKTYQHTLHSPTVKSTQNANDSLHIPRLRRLVRGEAVGELNLVNNKEGPTTTLDGRSIVVLK